MVKNIKLFICGPCIYNKYSTEGHLASMKFDCTAIILKQKAIRPQCFCNLNAISAADNVYEQSA